MLKGWLDEGLNLFGTQAQVLQAAWQAQICQQTIQHAGKRARAAQQTKHLFVLD